MTDADDQLSRLFREGPAPDRDEAFAGQVMVEVDRMRRRANLVLGVRLAISFVVLTLAAVALGLASPNLSHVGAWFAGPQLMSVPVSLVALTAVVVAAVEIRRRLRGRRA